MTVDEAVTYVRTLLGEDSAAFWSDAQLVAFVQRSLLTVYSIAMNARQEYFLSSSNISYAADTELYNLPAGCTKITLVERVDEKPYVTVLPIDITEKNKYALRNGDVFNPGQERYFIAGGQIGIAPIPTQAVNNALKIWTVNTPTLPTGSTSLGAQLNDFDHEVIAWGAYMRAAARDKQLLATIAPVYKELKDQLIQNVQTRINQEPRGIIDTDAMHMVG